MVSERIQPQQENQDKVNGKKGNVLHGFDLFCLSVILLIFDSLLRPTL